MWKKGVIFGYWSLHYLELITFLQSLISKFSLFFISGCRKGPLIFWLIKFLYFIALPTFSNAYDLCSFSTCVALHQVSLTLFPSGELEAFWIFLKHVEPKYLNHEQRLLTPWHLGFKWHSFHCGHFLNLNCNGFLWWSSWLWSPIHHHGLVNKVDLVQTYERGGVDISYA